MCEKWQPTEGFIAQTARDYDMPVWRAKEIIEKDPENMYENLEAYLVDRSNGIYESDNEE